jgi:hypothetical protein
MKFNKFKLIVAVALALAVTVSTFTPMTAKAALQSVEIIKSVVVAPATTNVIPNTTNAVVSNNGSITAPAQLDTASEGAFLLYQLDIQCSATNTGNLTTILAGSMDGASVPAGVYTGLTNTYLNTLALPGNTNRFVKLFRIPLTNFAGATKIYALNVGNTAASGNSVTIKSAKLAFSYRP